MKAYIISIVGAILLSALVTALVSDKKMGRFIKGIARLLVFSVLVTPLVALFRGDGDLPSGASEIGTDSGYLARCTELLRESYGEEVGAVLADYPVWAETEISLSENGRLEKITVKIGQNGINEQDGHIDMTAGIESALEERFRCEVEVIWCNSRETER